MATPVPEFPYRRGKARGATQVPLPPSRRYCPTTVFTGIPYSRSSELRKFTCLTPGSVLQTCWKSTCFAHPKQRISYAVGRGDSAPGTDTPHSTVTMVMVMADCDSKPAVFIRFRKQCPRGSMDSTDNFTAVLAADRGRRSSRPHRSHQAPRSLHLGNPTSASPAVRPSRCLVRRIDTWIGAHHRHDNPPHR